MKQTHICPKCNCVDIARIKAFSSTSTTSAVQLSKWGTSFGFYDRYVCTRCGFMEHYANLEDKGWQKWLKKRNQDGPLDSDFV